LDINPEIYHLMNASAQRISIKSLDMHRQSIMKSDGGTSFMRGANKSIAGMTAETSYGGFAGTSISKGSGSFPEVVSFLSNPF
jgi:hypothetical protein